MMRFYQSLMAHRNMIKVALILVSVVAMTLSMTTGALADGDDVSP